MAMDRNEREAALLIEAQRVEIIIRRHQPEPLAACFSCHLCDCLDQHGADPDPRLGAIDRHDLAVLILERVREQSHPVPFQHGTQASLPTSLIYTSLSTNATIPPLF